MNLTALQMNPITTLNRTEKIGACLGKFAKQPSTEYYKSKIKKNVTKTL